MPSCAGKGSEFRVPDRMPGAQLGGDMEFANPFEAEGNWYRGNLHIHTTESDGIHTPDQAARLYRDRGYDFICISDHHRVTSVKNKPEDLLIIPGAEMGRGPVHVVGVDVSAGFDAQGMKLQEVIDRINGQRGMAIIAHPYWSAITSAELAGAQGYAGFEIFNNVCNNIKGKGYSTVHFDEVLQSGKRILGFASDDTHCEKDLFGGCIMVKARSLEKECIMDSLRKGLFYSSTGMSISGLEVKEGKITISCQASESVNFVGYGFMGNLVCAEAGATLTRAEYQVKGTEKYLRIEITGKSGLKAWTNPMFL